MSDGLENDEILKRLRAEDPASAADAEPPGERDAVRARTARLIEGDLHAARPKLLASTRRRLAAAGAVVAIVVGVGLNLILGGSTSGPAPALAIDKGERWVTLRIEKPNASDDQMNSELAAAGIDRVRVISVPGPQYSVGTWAGYAEFGPACEGGVDRFGFGVDIPAATPSSPANRHSAESLIHLTVRRPESGALSAETLGTPYSRATLRVNAETIDNPRYSAKILVPIRAKQPGDGPSAHEIGVAQLIALGGVFAQYGKAIEDGRTSCSDFGLKPLTPATYPPNDRGWVDVRIADTQAGAAEMTREIRAAGINGQVRLLPAQPEEVGQFLGFQRIPAAPPRYHGVGSRLDAVPHNSAGRISPHATALALRTSAFTAVSDARWVFYVGRQPRPGERSQVVTRTGPHDAEAALKADCPSALQVITRTGSRRCESSPSLQVPAPPR
jgi:hypothetical protein